MENYRQNKLVFIIYLRIILLLTIIFSSCGSDNNRYTLHSDRIVIDQKSGKVYFLKENKMIIHDIRNNTKQSVVWTLLPEFNIEKEKSKNIYELEEAPVMEATAEEAPAMEEAE